MISFIYTILCIACLCVGFFCGYRLNNEKPIHIQNPNINNYDGTSQGQKELRNIGTGL